MVRSTFPDSWIYVNEAFPPFTVRRDSFGHSSECAKSIPPEIDLYSVDMYPDQTANSLGFNGTTADAQRVYTQLLYPALGAHQRVLLIPPGYSSADPAARQQECGTDDCPAVMLDWARFFWDWAQADRQVAGLMPWHLHNLGDHGDSKQRYYYGVCSMPAVSAFWQRVGGTIAGGPQERGPQYHLERGERDHPDDLCDGSGLP